MSKNNNKQTLFRFVSHRNPNLAEVKAVNLSFIQRAKEFEGVFDLVSETATHTKLQALLLEASTFESTAIKSVEDLEKDGFEVLIETGKSIANQNKLLPGELAKCKEKYLRIVDPKTIQHIWDNFIYQYLTQKDFYVKEALAFIIKALHVGYVQTLELNEELKKVNGEDLTKKALSAVIVIPATIFGSALELANQKYAKVKKELTNKDNGLLAIDADKFEKEQGVLAEKENLKQLKTELERLQKNYASSYERELKKAKSAYDSKNSENVEVYENQLDVIEQLEASKAPEEEIKSAFEVLKTLEIPPFEFSFRKELNWSDIYKQLSDESFTYFIENFTTEGETFNEEVDLEKAEITIVNDEELTIDGESFSFKHNSYDQIVSDINGLNNSFSRAVLSESNLSQDEFVNVGGVLVPISSTGSNPIPHLSYVIRAQKIGFFNPNRGYVTFQINVENSSWSVSNAVITAVTGSEDTVENIGSIQVVNNKVSFPSFLINKIRNINDLNIQIFFLNGREATLDLGAIVVKRLYTGILSLKPVDTTGEPTDGNVIEHGPTSGKQFGLKRLGVAEYMKVTQSVHAYVPGEVSNIENVMASELRHKSINEFISTEDTITTTKSQEVEKVSDTSKVNRAEMQTEVIKELDRQKTFQSHANFSGGTKVYKFDTGVGFASNNAQYTSNRQAVTKSQEVTERAMESVQSKISEERISKIIQEVSLTNVHEYDNRGAGETPPTHITGVYRWVDKKMKNQIFNYGKRTMFEFMVPEPAKLHRLALATAPSGHTLTAPVDPRKARAPHQMTSYSTADKQLLEYWAGVYGVTLTPFREEFKQIPHEITGYPNKITSFGPVNTSFDIESDYTVNSININLDLRRKWSLFYGQFLCSDFKGGAIHLTDVRGNYHAERYINNLNLTNTVNFQHSGFNIKNVSLGIRFNCRLSDEAVNAWKQENFNAIIDAYQTALSAYNDEVASIEAEQAAKAEEQKDTMGNFYRSIESNLLKHNCIAYLLQNYLTSLGQGFTSGDKMLNFKVNLSDDLDRYTSMAKFLEQAFEWEIMDYNLYPYYWADRKQWQDMYLSENTDTLFRSFLQSGLARVVVTVKPEFEEAVQYFLETGQVWQGGESPVIGDPLYMSIAQEMQDPTGVPQGNYWITRIPTTLTILQAKSAGLKVDDALPIFPEDEPENCENPEQLETETSFTLDDVQLSSTGTGDTTLYSN